MVKRILFCATVLLFAALFSTEASASLRANGGFFYGTNSRTIGGVTTTGSRLSQSYSAGIRHALTDTIDIGLDVMWYIIETKTSKSSSYNPVFMVNFSPPGIYRFKFGHSRTDSDPSEGQHITSTVTYVSFSLPQSRWPSLNISYNISENFNHTSPKTMDVTSTSMRLGSGYGFKMWDGSGRLSYSFNNSLSEDNVASRSSEVVSHSVGVNYSKSFMSGRMDATWNVGLTTSTYTNESKGVPSRFATPTPTVNGVACLACVGTVAIEAELADNDTVTSVVPNIDIANPNWHMGVDTGASNTVAGLFMYVSTTLAEEAAIFSSYNFGWQLYTSPDNIAWTFAGSLAPTYDTFYHRFRFDFADITDRYFKVVNTIGQGVAINVTEMSVFSYLLVTPKFKAERSADSSSIGMRLSYKAGRGSLNYNIGISQSKSGGSSPKSTSINQGLNGSYNVIPRYFSLSGTISNTKSKSSGGSESETLSYRLGAGSNPLPTLRGGFTYNHSESSNDGVKRYESNSIGMGTTMNVYRGVDMRLSFSINESKNLIRKSKSKSKSMSGSLSLRPWKAVSLRLNGGVSESEAISETGKSSSTSDSLSGSLSVRLTNNIYYSNAFHIEPLKSEAHNLGWRVTRSVNTSMNYYRSDFTESRGITIGWAPIQKAGFSLGFSESEQLSSGNTRESMYLRGYITFL